jgi:hypothetical protein
MSGAEAAYLLATLPDIQSYKSSTMSAEQRTAVGLSAPQARAAKAAFAGLRPDARLALLEAAMPADPTVLWEHGPDVAAVATVWTELFGVRATIPDWLLAEATTGLTVALTGWARRGVGVTVVRELCTPRPDGPLSVDGKTTTNQYGGLRTEAAEGEPFTGQVLVGASAGLAWLAYRVPWGDPLRTTLPGALGRIRARLRNPDLRLDAPPAKVGSPPPGGPALQAGVAGPEMVPYFLVPARLSGVDDAALAFIGEETAAALRLVLGDEADAMVTAPAGVAGMPQDPRLSVPRLVEEVATATGLGPAAAAYHLQLLALPDPTDRNIQAWNGWKPAELRAAQKALVDARLAVAAKRERAGRAVFLPGGWRPAPAPGVPIETWKEPLYTRLRGLTLVRGDVPSLFRRAWGRYAAGDTPRYFDLKETK